MKSQAQRDSQINAMNAARGAAARRAEAKRQEDWAKADRAKAEANHVHSWKNWEYVMDYTHEVRECRECRFAEMRPVRI